MPRSFRLRNLVLAALAVLGAWFMGGKALAQDGGRSQAAQAIERLRVASGGSARVDLAPSGLARFVAIPAGLPVPLGANESASPSAKALAFLRAHGKAFGLGATPEVRLLRTAPRDVARMEHVRLQQTSRGLPVAGAELIVHLRDDAVTSVNGHTLDAAELLTVPSEPTLSSEEALLAARALMAETIAGELTSSSPASRS